MEHSGNSWQILKRWLSRANLSQNKLAEILNISSSAVSQIKHGKLNLSAEQIKKIITCFNPPTNEVERYYTSIFNDRYLKNSNDFKVVSAHGSQIKSGIIPCLSFSQLRRFEPALHHLRKFAEIHGGKMQLPERSDILRDFVGLKFSPEEAAKLNLKSVKPNTVLYLDPNKNFVNNRPVLAKIFGGDIITGTFLHENNQVTITDSSTPFHWNPEREPGRLSWIYHFEW